MGLSLGLRCLAGAADGDGGVTAIAVPPFLPGMLMPAGGRRSLPRKGLPCLP